MTICADMFTTPGSEQKTHKYPHIKNGGAPSVTPNSLCGWSLLFFSWRRGPHIKNFRVGSEMGDVGCVFLHIYIYVCVCVCFCLLLNHINSQNKCSGHVTHFMTRIHFSETIFQAMQFPFTGLILAKTKLHETHKI